MHSVIFLKSSSFLVEFRKVICGGERCCLLHCAMSHSSRVVSWSAETGRVGVSLLTLVMTGRGQMTTLPREGGDPASVRGHVLGPQVSQSLFCSELFLSRSDPDSPREDRQLCTFLLLVSIY